MWAFAAASAYNLMVLTLERYYAITKPLHYDTEKVFARMPYILCFIWIFGFVASTPVALFYEVIGSVCTLTLPIRFPLLFDIMSPYYIVIYIMVPSVIMIGAYVQMGVALRESGFTSKTNSQAQKNLFYTCLTLVMVFALTGVNHMVSLVMQVVGFYPHNLNIQYQVSASMVIVNSSINPFIYCMRYKEFQHRIKELFTSQTYTTPTVPTPQRDLPQRDLPQRDLPQRDRAAPKTNSQ